MGGTTSTTNTSQSQKVELPAWVDQASQENYQFAKDVAGRPLQQYGGQRVADPSAMTTQANDLIKSNVGAMNPYVDAATGNYNAASDMYKSTAPWFAQAGSQFGKADATLDKA